MTEQADGTTPGADRVLQFFVGAQSFSIRRPSRADLAEIWRRFARKVAGTGLPLESDLLNTYDGQGLLAEARFEVLLMSKTGPRGDVIDLGERAPAHWQRPILDGESKTVATIIAFDKVDPEEFDGAAEQIDKLLQKKAPNPKSPSTVTVPGQTSG